MTSMMIWTMADIDAARVEANQLLDRAREPDLSDDERVRRRSIYQHQIEWIGAMLTKYHADLDSAAQRATLHMAWVLR